MGFVSEGYHREKKIESIFIESFLNKIFEGINSKNDFLYDYTYIILDSDVRVFITLNGEYYTNGVVTIAKFMKSIDIKLKEIYEGLKSWLTSSDSRANSMVIAFDIPMYKILEDE